MKLLLAAISGHDAMIQFLYLLGVGVILGLIYWLVEKAPIIVEPFKAVLKWLIILFGVLVLINFIMTLMGIPIIDFRK